MCFVVWFLFYVCMRVIQRQIRQLHAPTMPAYSVCEREMVNVCVCVCVSGLVCACVFVIEYVGVCVFLFFCVAFVCVWSNGKYR